MSEKNKIETLFENHKEKDESLWKQLWKVFEKDDSKAAILTSLIHDNNYMLISLIQKIADFERKENYKSGNK